jgi:FG-GAP repeat
VPGLVFTLIFLVIPTGLFPLSILDTLAISTGQNAEAATTLKTDFNGDGYSDQAIGVPHDTVGTIADAGAVNVIYGSSDGLRATALSPGNGTDNQRWTQGGDIKDNPEPSDFFGWALATGDFNKDGYSDLAIGVPNEDVGTIGNAGAVNVIYGSSDGLNATALFPVGNGRDNQIWTQNSPGIEGDPELGEFFGWALATGDFNKDEYSDLAIGVPTIDDAGAVNVIYGSSDGLAANGLPPHNGRNDQIWNQSSADIEGDPEPGESFGWGLATGDFNNDTISDLAIGTPFDTVDTIGNAGAVNVIYGSSDGLNATGLPRTDGRHNQIWTQNSADIEGDPEDGDFFGAALATGDFNNDRISDLAIGVEQKDVGTIVDAGAVNVIYGSSDGLRATGLHPHDGRNDQIWNQSSAEIYGEPELGDAFGTAVATGDFNKDGTSDLAIGVPFEEEEEGSTIFSPGAVNVIYGSSDGLNANRSSGSGEVNQIWYQSSADIEGNPERDDNFGSDLATGDFNNDTISDLAIGVPHDTVGTIDNVGSVNVIYGSAVGVVDVRGGLSATVPPGGIGRADQIWNQSSADIKGDPRIGNSFGFSLG